MLAQHSANLGQLRTPHFRGTIIVEIMDRSAQAARIIPKLRAEADLCNTLAALSAIGVLTVLVWHRTHLDKLTLAVQGLVLILAIAAGWFRTKRVLLREFAYCRKLQSTIDEER